MAFQLASSGPIINCEVALTSSKSISNRVLIIRALSGASFRIDNLSTSTDTQVLLSALSNLSEEINVKDAGTAFRFLVSYLSAQTGRFILTGSSRMKLRPIGPLIDSLHQLGAKIDYLEEEGFPPINIIGKKIIGGQVTLNRSLSSQFASSLLMISPYFENGLTLELVGEESSDSYLEMTIGIMKYFGADINRETKRIVVSPKLYTSKDFKVENDWTAASYWYSLCALNPGSEFALHGLNESSYQGDSIVANLMQAFGVNTKFEKERVVISSVYEKLSNSIADFKFDFSSHPDLVMTFAVLCAAKRINGTFTGIHTLRIKESDRLAVLKTELNKCGVEVLIEENNMKIVSKGTFKHPEIINVHNDHRIAMAFAPLASVLSSVSFDDINVVAKSYPEFWKQLSLTGLKFTS